MALQTSHAVGFPFATGGLLLDTPGAITRAPHNVREPAMTTCAPNRYVR